MSKVAVINRTNFKNYGSVLQCYALCHAVEKLGYESEIIWESGNLSKNFDFRPRKLISSVFKLIIHPKLISSTLTSVSEVGDRVISNKTIERFDEFVKSEIVQQKISHRALIKLAKSEEYKKFICGSDQIWCSTTLYPDPLMYLRFAPENKRVAYAPSIGRDYIPDYNRRKMKKYINEIPALSVRETVGRKLIKELTGRDAELVLDPTLLFDKKFWDKLKNDVKIDDEYLLCYFLDTPTREVQEKIAEFAKNKKIKIIALVSKLDVCEELGVSVAYPDCGPREFLSFIEQAASIVTDSYHGMLFSITYGKEFWSVERAYRQYDQSSRQKTVLEMLSLENRYLLAEGDIAFASEEIEYSRIEDILAQRRSESLEFLKHAIES